MFYYTVKICFSTFNIKIYFYIFIFGSLKAIYLIYTFTFMCTYVITSILKQDFGILSYKLCLLGVDPGLKQDF